MVTDETMFVWDYSFTLMSAQDPNLFLSGTYYATGGQHGSTPSTWALTGVGNTVNFTASGTIVDENPFTIHGSNGSSMTVYAPGPLPEPPTVILLLSGLAGIGLWGWHRSWA